MFGEMKNKEAKTMKKMKFMLFAVAAIAAASCAKEESLGNTSDVTLVPMTFNAGSEGTKVLLQDNKAIHWESSDKIKIYDGISADLAAFETSEDGPSVSFSGKVSEGSTEYYAVYPHTAANGFDAANKTFSITLPETQTASAGNVPTNAFISVAKADADNNLAFKNVTAFVKFSLSDATNIKSVTISGNAGESLTGDMTVKIGDNGIPTNTPGSNMNYTATLSGTFESRKDYYIAVRSAAFAKGITISVYKNDGTNGSRAYLSSKTAPETNISRNLTLDLKQLDVAQFKTSAPSDQFLAYLHGYNVEIGDIKLHKNSGIKPKLVTASASDQATNISSYIHNQSALLFLDHNENCAFTFNSNQTQINGDVKLIGRKSTSKAIIQFESSSYLGLSSGSLMCKNICFDFTKRTNYICTINTNTKSDLTHLYFDRCEMKKLQNRIVYNNNASKGIVNTCMIYCNVEISSDNICMFHTTPNMTKLYIQQTVLYNNSETGIGFSIYDNQNATLDRIDFVRNTIVGWKKTSIGGFIRCNATHVTITNNLFHSPNMEADSYLLNNSVAPQSITVEGNYCHNNKQRKLFAFKTNPTYTFTNFYNGTENYISTNSDPASGNFISTNSGYGATR